MSTISRRMPNSNISYLAAINALKLAIDNLPPGTITLPADITTDLPLIHTAYNQKYNLVTTAEAEFSIKTGLKNKAAFKLKTITIDFLKVLRITVDRSVSFEDGIWAAADISYYNLDETGGNLPDIRSDEKIIYWANEVVTGDAARKAAAASSPDMVNPTAAEVAALYTPMQTAMGAVILSASFLSSARNNLNSHSTDVAQFITRAWDFLDANYGNLEESAKRNILRQYGVTYTSTGTPNTFTFIVKDAAGTNLEGAKIVLIQSGAEAFTNEDGRVTLETNSVGPVKLLISYPGKQNHTALYTIPDTDHGQTYDLGTITLADA